jgi:hypothetical protein
MGAVRLSGDFGSHYELGQEYNEPHYRVSFWTGTSEEWVEIYEADIDEVLAWVQANADGRFYTVWARVRLPRGETEDDVVDVRLYGTDPTSWDEDFPSWARRAASPARAIRGQHGRREKRSVLPSDNLGRPRISARSRAIRGHERMFRLGGSPVMEDLPMAGEFVRYICAFCNQSTDDDPRSSP